MLPHLAVGRGRTGDRQVGPHRPVQPRPRADLRQHRLRPAGPAEPWGRGSAYGLGSARRPTSPASSSSPAAARGPAAGRPTGGAAFCRPSTRACRSRPPADPILDVASPAGVDPQLQRDSLDLVRGLNQRRLDAVGDPEIASPDQRLRTGLPHADQRPGTDGPVAARARRRSTCTAPKPGGASFANNCLLARRLVERGVRFVNLYHDDWDHHSDVAGGLKAKCGETDKAIAALITDLKQSRPARRHARRLGRRVRPHADGRVQPRPRPQPWAATTTPRPTPCGSPAAV